MPEPLLFSPFLGAIISHKKRPFLSQIAKLSTYGRYSDTLLGPSPVTGSVEVRLTFTDRQKKSALYSQPARF